MDLLLTIVTAVLAAVTLIAAAVAGYQVSVARCEAEDARDRARREATMQFYANTLSLRTQLSLAIPSDRDAAAIEALTTRLSADDSTLGDRAALADYLSYWELLAASINADVEVFDEELLFLTARGTLTAVWTNYRPYIELNRERYGAPKIGIELETVAAKWGQSDYGDRLRNARRRRRCPRRTR